MLNNQNKRVLKNTLILYVRQIFLTLISLYTLRLVLNGLGIESYGIYTVVAGIVGLASFLPSAMSSATQRYFSFALGRKDQAAVTKIFSVNILIYVAICVLALAVLESAGLWFVHETLNVPVEHAEAAKLLYQISIFTFISSLLASPFLSIIIAHEEMDLYLFVAIFEAVAKLAAAITITFTPWEKLTTYGSAIFIASAATTLIYIIVCTKRYPSCTFKRSTLDRATFKEILSFTGWTLFGHLTTVARNQAVTILLYQAFNPAVATARAIATTVASQVTVFSSNFNTSLYSPIIKHYSAGQREEMFSVIIWGSNLTFFLMWVFALPLYLEMETVLRIWLVTPPPEAVNFSRLALIEAVISAISLPLVTAARAPGQMRIYELTLGTIQLFILVTSWALLFIGQPAASVFFIAIFANVIMFFIRLFMVNRLIGLNMSLFLKKAALPAAYVALISGIISKYIELNIQPGIVGSITTITLSMLTSTLLMYFFGLDIEAKLKIVHAIRIQTSKMRK